MTTPALSEDTERLLAALEDKLARLIRLCDQLADANHKLQSDYDALDSERQSLIDQNEQLRARVNAMVARLKGLEQPL